MGNEMENETEKEPKNKMEDETYVTKTDSAKKNFVEWILCWICLGFFFLFFSNIFMHLSTCQRGNADNNTLTLRKYENCTIGEDGQYINAKDYIPMKLTYAVYDPSKEISKIHIDFGKPLDAYLWVKVYYPDAEGNYPSEEARRERLVAGLTEHVIDVEAGKYQEIRIDFADMAANREVSVANIYAGEADRMMLYADKAWRYRIWGICFLGSLVLSILFFVWRTFRTFWDKLCRKLKSFVIHCYHSIDISKSLKVVIGGILIGVFLEGIAMLVHSRGFNGRAALIFFAIGMILLSFFVFREAYTQKIERISLFIFLLITSVFICVIPISTGMSWDDETHYYRIISMARAFSGTITEADDLFNADTYTVVANEQRFQRDHSKPREYNARYNEKYKDGAILKNNYAFSYKDISYLPFVVGIWFSYGLGLSFCMTAFVAKVFQILFMGLILYASMKNLRSGQILLLVFAMVPTVLILSISYSYDSWLTFLMIYAFSRYFGELQRKEDKLTFAGFCKIFIPAFLALLPKLIYAPMLFLMAYMPKSKWKEKKWRLAYHSCFIFAALLMVSAILYAASGRLQIGSSDGRGSVDINGDLQLQYIIHHFDTYCHTMLRFLRSYFSYTAAEEYLTNLFVDSKDIQFLAIPLLLAAAVWDRSSLDGKTIPVLSKLAALLMPPAIIVICATVMYLVFTQVGAEHISGCQGRYLLPTLFPFLFMISRWKPYTDIRQKMLPVEYGQKVLVEVSAEEIGNMVLIFLSACFLLYNFWACFI